MNDAHSPVLLALPLPRACCGANVEQSQMMMSPRRARVSETYTNTTRKTNP